MLALSDAIELVGKLDRTIGYPRDDGGIENLARGLMKATDLIHVDAARIVERCSETSQYCPTDADLLSVARDLRGPQQFTPSGPPKCAKCHGTGWEILYSLHTLEGGSHNFTRKERISEQQANTLWPKIDPQKQMIYSAARRCSCPVPSDPQHRAANDRGDL